MKSVSTALFELALDQVFASFSCGLRGGKFDPEFSQKSPGNVEIVCRKIVGDGNEAFDFPTNARISHLQQGEIALPLHHFRTFQETTALVILPDGKSTSRPNGAGNGERPQGAPFEDRGEHERTRRFKLPRPGRASQGGSGRKNPFLGVLGGLGGHAGGISGKDHGGSEEARR